MIEFDEINKEERFAIKNEDNKELVEIPVFLNNDVCKISLIEKNNEKVMNEVKIIQNDLENNKTLNCFEKLYSFEKSDQNTNKTIIEIQILGSNYVSKIKTFNDVIVMNCHENKLNISENTIDPAVQHIDSQNKESKECENKVNFVKSCQNEILLDDFIENVNNQQENSTSISRYDKEESNKHQAYKEYDNNYNFDDKTCQDNSTHAENEIHFKDDTSTYDENIDSIENAEIENVNKINSLKSQDHISQTITIVNDFIFEVSSTNSSTIIYNNNLISSSSVSEFELEKHGNNEDKFLNQIDLSNDLIRNERTNKTLAENQLDDENIFNLNSLFALHEQNEEFKGVSVKSTIKNLEDLNCNMRKESTDIEQKLGDFQNKKNTNLVEKSNPIAFGLDHHFKVGSIKIRKEFKKFENEVNTSDFIKNEGHFKYYKKSSNRNEEDINLDTNTTVENTLDYNKRVSEAISMFEANCETRNTKINNKTQKNKTDNFTQIEIANESKEMIEFDLVNNEILETDFNSKKRFSLSNLFKICRQNRKKE
jgi:hypothetical protein